MWDKHWCAGATKRVGEMAPRMNDFVVAVRQRGALIIHAPSDTMNYYKTWPQYALAQSGSPLSRLQNPRCNAGANSTPRTKRRCPSMTATTGGCDVPFHKDLKAWSHQIDTLEIKPEDAITDTAQAYYLMRQRGIENVLVMGVHLNICVLGRPFAIRQLVAQGLNVALVRDLTDTLYNPAMKPFVAHCTGTDLVVEHVEKFWCPTITSDQLLGGSEFRFADDNRPRRGGSPLRRRRIQNQRNASLPRAGGTRAAITASPLSLRRYPGAAHRPFRASNKSPAPMRF